MEGGSGGRCHPSRAAGPGVSFGLYVPAILGDGVATTMSEDSVLIRFSFATRGSIFWVEQRPEPDKIQLPIANVLAVDSAKGGVGKTTCAVNLVIALAGLGHRVGR